jgi:hypothetical protein
MKTHNENTTGMPWLKTHAPKCQTAFLVGSGYIYLRPLTDRDDLASCPYVHLSRITTTCIRPYRMEIGLNTPTKSLTFLLGVFY